MGVWDNHTGTFIVLAFWQMTGQFELFEGVAGVPLDSSVRDDHTDEAL